MSKTLGEITWNDVAEYTVTISSHLSTAAFAAMFMLIGWGRQMNASGVCTSEYREVCASLVATHNDWQLLLAGAGLGFILLAAAIHLYQDYRRDRDEQ